ncbi:MAG: hypothetical protein JWO73_2 [Candidatus Taylorbacteria bacterium]|nr:hypothetical protein [Candidatus Taylorbacteria bacterium]
MTDNNPITKTVHFFDKLEDKIRERLSRTPILYAFIGGVGIVLFWRGVWHIADGFEGAGGIFSLIIGSIILLLTGAFVSTLIGNRIILTGLRGEKKLAEKTREELESEESELKNIQKTLLKVEEHLTAIEKELPHEKK